MNIVVN